MVIVLLVLALLMVLGFLAGYTHGSNYTRRIERRRHDVLTRILRGI